MGRSFFHLAGLPPPFSSITDRVMAVSRGRHVVVRSAGPKIVLFFDGHARATLDGRVLGELKPRDALVVAGPCRHVYIPLTRRREMRMHVMVIHFATDRSGMGVPPMAPINVPEQSDLRPESPGPTGPDGTEEPLAGYLGRHFGRTMHLPGAVTPEVMRWVDGVRAECAVRGPGHRHRAAACATLILTEIQRHFAGAPAPAGDVAAGSQPAWLVEQAKEFLVEHLAEPLTLEQVAWHLSLSAEHLARTFRKATGRTVFDYLRHLRIEQAKTLLAGSRFPVVEVARRSGFSSSTLFGRNFRQATGESPLAYRRRIAGDAEFSPSTFVGPEPAV